MDLAPLRAERGELPSKQGAFERRRLLSKGSVEKTAGFFQVAERSVELGVRREPVGVAREQIAFGDRVELVETDAGPAHHGDGEGAVHVDDGGGRHLPQHVVEGDDLLPLGRGVARRLGVARSDGRLDVKARELLAARRAPEEEEPFGEKRRVPERTILFVRPARPQSSPGPRSRNG